MPTKDTITDLPPVTADYVQRIADDCNSAPGMRLLGLEFQRIADRLRKLAGGVTISREVAERILEWGECCDRVEIHENDLVHFVHDPTCELNNAIKQAEEGPEMVMTLETAIASIKSNMRDCKSMKRQCRAGATALTGKIEAYEFALGLLSQVESPALMGDTEE